MLNRLAFILGLVFFGWLAISGSISAITLVVLWVISLVFPERHPFGQTWPLAGVSLVLIPIGIVSLFLARGCWRAANAPQTGPGECARCGREFAPEEATFAYNPHERICDGCSQKMSELEGRTFPAWK